jgi:murein DD-endopeptidase MepM/ murein hydrolase activator NlpD
MYANYSNSAEYRLHFYHPFSSKPRITQGWKGHTHQGIDLVPTNTEDTNVRAIGWQKVIKVSYQENGAGNYVDCQSLWYKDIVIIKYFHLKQFSKLKVGDKLNHGDIIGLMGNSGHSFGAHLHLEVWVNGININPLGEEVLWIHG